MQGTMTLPTILLGSGGYFDYARPKETAHLVSLEDVAYALAFMPRFAGQCVDQETGRRTHYSIAEHSIRVADWLGCYRGCPELRLHGLMHDASEALCMDIPMPLKILLPDYRAIEKQVEAALLHRFGVSHREAAVVKEGDLILLATERRDLMAWDKGDPWAILEGVEPLPGRIYVSRDQHDTAALFMSLFRQWGGKE